MHSDRSQVGKTSSIPVERKIPIIAQWIRKAMNPETGVKSPLFSVADSATYLGMSKDWVYERLKTLVPHVKIGGSLKFRREDLDRYIASQTVAPMNTRDIRSPVSLRELMREPRRKKTR